MAKDKNSCLLSESAFFFLDFSFDNALLCIRQTDICPLPADKRDRDKTVPDFVCYWQSKIIFILLPNPV